MCFCMLCYRVLASALANGFALEAMIYSMQYMQSLAALLH